MLSTIDPSILVAIIGAPAALITAVGTVWLISRRALSPAFPGQTIGPTSTTQAQSPLGYPQEPPQTNGYRHVTHHELREVVADLKGELAASEARQNAKLDLIVTLLKDR